MKVNVFGDYYCNEKINICPKFSSVLCNSDLNIINFEAPIVKDITCAIEKVGANLSHNIETITNLKELNITDVCVANNHYFDFGELNAEYSNGALKDESIRVHGYNTSDKPGRIHYITDNWVIINVAESEYGVKSQEFKSGFLSISDPRLFVILKKFKDKGTNIILIVHAGLEDVLTPLDSWKDYFRAFIDFGVEIVIGHHPHVPQSHEVYNGKYIYYSLGNFIFQNSDKSDWHKIGQFVSLEISGDELKVSHGYTRNTSGYISLIEDESSIDEQLEKYFSYPLSLADNYRKLMMMDLKRIILSVFYPKILNFVPYFNKRKSRALDFCIHNLRFETHRFSQIEYINKEKARK
ncbi:CapA family protein [Vibrio sp. 1978]|uniref:CapA family protein n=1 Tax=Vibrio sp. 1978 TaxID=3074585 RepID=UPI002966BA1D|nr:CapA family protein [Vibrio sp. 1978]MDW3056446.1 CapA family protein [Vibrio sp. 1978]